MNEPSMFESSINELSSAYKELSAYEELLAYEELSAVDELSNVAKNSTVDESSIDAESFMKLETALDNLPVFWELADRKWDAILDWREGIETSWEDAMDENDCSLLVRDLFLADTWLIYGYYQMKHHIAVIIA